MIKFESLRYHCLVRWQLILKLKHVFISRWSIIIFYYRIVLQKYLEAQVLWLVTKCEIKFYDMEPQRLVVSEVGPET